MLYVQSEVNIPNLTKLINHLKVINKANFTMNKWLGVSEENKENWRHRPASELVKHMETGAGDCGTAGCIAGHINLIAAAEKEKPVYTVSKLQGRAEDWLGITFEESVDLFIPWMNVRRMEESDIDGSLTLERVIGVLEHLKTTAEAGRPVIDWFYNER